MPPSTEFQALLSLPCSVGILQPWKAQLAVSEGLSLDSTRLYLAPWDKTGFPLEASGAEKGLGGQQDRPPPAAVSSCTSGETQVPARAVPGPPPPPETPPLCRERSSLLPNASQGAASILRMWVALSRREGCEILGRQLQALPTLAGV